jgi:hypothetical protein
MVYVSERLMQLMQPESVSDVRPRSYVSEIAPGAYEVAGSGLVAYQSLKPPNWAPTGQGVLPPGHPQGLWPGRAPFSVGFSDGYYDYQIRAGVHERFGDDHVNLEILSKISGKILDNKHVK